MGDKGLNLNPEIVSGYLNENREFLDHYVHCHVPLDQLQTWIRQKSEDSRQQTKHSDHSVAVNGDFSPQENIQRWKVSLRGDKARLLRNITNCIQQDDGKDHLLHEIASSAASAVQADGFNLYLVNEINQEIRLHQLHNQSAKVSSQCTQKIGPGSTLAAYVAYTKEGVCLSPFVKNEQYPEGLGVFQASVHAVIAQPLFNTSGQVFGVIEVYRTTKSELFTSEEDEVFSTILLVGDLTIKCHELYHSMMRQRKLNDFLLTVTKSIFQDIVSMDTVIMKIMNYAKKLVNADRTSLFLLDGRTKELYARVFDMGDETEHSKPFQKEIRFSMDKGVAGYVASSGEILNIVDAYSDQRFNRNVDMQTGYRTQTILCMPIYIRGSIIGVVQMVNKLDGQFTKADEESFETFAVYCGLALHHAKLYEKIRRSEQKYKVALEVLSYHAQASEEEVEKLQQMTIPDLIPSITEYSYSPWSVTHEEKPLYVIYMFKDLLVNKSQIDIGSLYRFTLTVRKNYRNVPYHNWAHAFSVAHAMYTVIKTSKNEFSSLEHLGMFVACLCHDLDHRGKTNSFMVKSSTPLAALYSTSTMEHHHFNQTVAILQNEGHNIFRHFSSDEYKQVLGDIKHCILSTDLALFFSNRARLKELHDKDQFDWSFKDHRQMLMANCMTASDLCSMYKPWKLQLELVHVIMEEFWIQGDEEKQQGNQPIPMMDRDKADDLPQCQVGFLVGICLPCYEILAEILPETQPMVDGAKDNLSRWQELVNEQEVKQKEIESSKTTSS